MAADWLNVADTTPRISYTATGGQTAFTVPFLFFTDDNLNVYQNDALLVLNVGYTVAGVENPSGGTITLITGATVGDRIVIARSTALELTTHIPPSGPLDVPAINIQFSKFIAMLQEERDRFDRSLTQPDNEASLDMTLPSNRANKLLGFDSTGAPIAVLGPSSVADQFIGAALIESKAVAQVTTFDPTTNYLLLGGNASAGSAALAGYVKGTGSGSFSDGGGTSWKPVASGDLSTPVPGAAGDNTTDDRAALQTVMNAVAAAGGGYVHLAAKSFRVVINSGVTDLGLVVPSGVTLLMNGATINLECTGSVYGIRLQSDAHIIGPGTVAVTVSFGPGSQSIWHAPISLGAALGEVTSVGALGNYINATRWSIRRLRFTSVRSNGYKISGIGGISHGVIEDCEFPSDSTSIGCINFDWGTVGTISSAPASMAANLTNFNNGTAYTVHPNNIDIRRNKIGSMTNAASCPIRLSGVHAIRVDGFEIAQSNACGVQHVGGDLGYEFAPTAVKQSRHSGIVIRNGSILYASNGVGVSCDMYADNVANAIASFGYTPMLQPQQYSDIVFENIKTFGSTAPSASDGIVMSWMEGGTIRNCNVTGHQHGIIIREAVRGLLISGGKIDTNQQEGIYIGNSGAPPEEITVEYVRAYANGVSGSYAGIVCNNGKRHNIRNNILGQGGEGFQDFGVDVTSACVDVDVCGNHVIAATNVAYRVGTATSYNCVRVFTDNTVDVAPAIFSGVAIVPISYAYVNNVLARRFKTTRGTMTTTPGSGTWNTGDIVEFIDAQAGGTMGSYCVTGGTPGTWKNLPNLAA